MVFALTKFKKNALASHEVETMREEGINDVFYINLNDLVRFYMNLREYAQIFAKRSFLNLHFFNSCVFHKQTNKAKVIMNNMRHFLEGETANKQTAL